MYLSTDMWYKKVQVILGLIKRENLIAVTAASESRKMGQFTILLYPTSSFKGGRTPPMQTPMQTPTYN